MLVVSPRIRIGDDELRFTFVRSSGPGGQNVNKLNTKAVLRWSATTSSALPEDVRRRLLERYRRRITATGEIILTSDRFREQRQNERDCRVKLADMVRAVAEPPKPRRPTRPTRGSVQRRRAKKQAQSLKKQTRRRPGFEE